jgi:DNA-binding SARP family transcriptional activator
VLTIARTARWIELPEGQRVSCGRRNVLVLLLLELAAAHGHVPTRTVATNDLVSAIWPDAQGTLAGRNRLYVTLARLRRLGLRRDLMTEQGGYRLTESLEIQVVD